MKIVGGLSYFIGYVIARRSIYIVFWILIESKAFQTALAALGTRAVALASPPNKYLLVSPVHFLTTTGY